MNPLYLQSFCVAWLINSAIICFQTKIHEENYELKDSMSSIIKFLKKIFEFSSVVRPGL